VEIRSLRAGGVGEGRVIVRRGVEGASGELFEANRHRLLIAGRYSDLLLVVGILRSQQSSFLRNARKHSLHSRPSRAKDSDGLGLVHGTLRGGFVMGAGHSFKRR